MVVNDLKWFQDIYLSLDSLQHKKLVAKLAPEAKQKFSAALMPTIMSIGRERYSCQAVWHSGLSCRAYALDKFTRAWQNCAKILFIASFIPQIVAKRKKLFSKDPRTVLKTLRKILWRYFRATLWLVLGTSLPFVSCC